MEINPSIFKAYDIRGVYPSDINEEVAYRIGKAYADFMHKHNPGKKLRIVVARDMRLSSPQLARELIRGVTEQGMSVVNIGLASTPTFYFAVANYGFDGGLQISASHNPKEYNGVKLVRPRAVPISGDTGINDIRELVIKNKFKPAKNKGRVKEKKGVLKDEVQHALKYVNAKKLKPFKVVADPANSMGILYLEELFRHLPCKLIKINFNLDGTFPTHQPDPSQEETLAELKKRVMKEKADIGIATDGDGDRVFFVDNLGERIGPEIIRGLMAQAFLKIHPGAKICYDVRPGKITEDMILEAGGKPVLTKVGHSLIKETLLREGAIFAGESSGHFVLKTESGAYEVPMIITLKMLELMTEKNQSLADIIKPYRKYYHSGEINFRVADKEAKIKALEQEFRDADKIMHLDGLSVFYQHYWFNVRASNTESLLRLNLEADSEEKMKEMQDKIIKIINS
jgi:phosphomannomutase